MKNRISVCILAISVLVACLTRFYQLGNVPSGLNADEAGQGYSAYSLLKTGRDEYGKSFPVLFRSSGDFKTPVYTYFLVPSIAVFGLNSFAVRFPSALFSVLTVVFVYFLIKRLISTKNYSRYFLLPSLSSLLLAISPWAILFGRTAYECSLALFFLVGGCLFFYEGLRRHWFLVLSALFFAISIPAYHSERIVTPLLCAALFLRFRKRFWQKEFLKYILVGGIVFIIVILPTVFIINTPGFFARVNDLNIMSVGRPAGILPDYHGFFSFLINNKILLNIREFLSLYVSYFSPRFIFVLGDSGPRSSFPELGTFFVWQAPFYLLGFYFILVKRLGELRYFLLSFLFISPITASLTRDPYSSTRALQMVIPLAVIIALGIIESYFYMRRWRLAGFRFLFGVIAAGFVIYSLLKLYSSVIVLNETYRGASWEYGWKEIAEIIKNLDSNYPVKVDSSRNVGYVELAFFMKADPKKYQLDNYEVSEEEYYTNLSMNSEKKIGRVTWGAIDWRNDLLQKQYLIGDSLAISDQQIKEHNLNLIREVYYKDGSLDLRVVETNPRR